jgi:hypothetical protein
MRGDPPKGFVVAEAMVLASPENDGAAALAAIASLAKDTTEDGLLNNAAAHRIFKGILHRSVAFCAAVLPHLRGQLLALAAYNRAAFVLVSLWEGGAAELQSAMRAELQPKMKQLAALPTPGAVLLAKLVRGEKVEPAAAAVGKRPAAAEPAPAAKKVATAAAAAPTPKAAAAAKHVSAAAEAPAAPKTPAAKTPAAAGAKTPAAKTPAAKTPAAAEPAGTLKSDKTPATQGKKRTIVASSLEARENAAAAAAAVATGKTPAKKKSA